jgi:hypothetical protein
MVQTRIVVALRVASRLTPAEQRRVALAAKKLGTFHQLPLTVTG